jgi:hypothetical protein
MVVVVSLWFFELDAIIHIHIVGHWASISLESLLFSQLMVDFLYSQGFTLQITSPLVDRFLMNKNICCVDEVSPPAWCEKRPWGEGGCDCLDRFLMNKNICCVDGCEKRPWGEGKCREHWTPRKIALGTVVTDEQEVEDIVTAALDSEAADDEVVDDEDADEEEDTPSAPID